MHTQEASSVPVCIEGPSGRGRLASGWQCLEGSCAGLLAAAKGGGPVGVSVSLTYGGEAKVIRRYAEEQQIIAYNELVAVMKEP